jgi:hypothetical protein
VTRLLLDASREHTAEDEVPCTFGTAPRNRFIGSRVCLRPFPTIRPSTRSLSKKTKASYTLGDPDAILESISSFFETIVSRNRLKRVIKAQQELNLETALRGNRERSRAENEYVR